MLALLASILAVSCVKSRIFSFCSFFIFFIFILPLILFSIFLSRSDSSSCCFLSHFFLRYIFLFCVAVKFCLFRTGSRQKSGLDYKVTPHAFVWNVAPEVSVDADWTTRLSTTSAITQLSMQMASENDPRPGSDSCLAWFWSHCVTSGQSWNRTNQWPFFFYYF